MSLGPRGGRANVPIWLWNVPIPPPLFLTRHRLLAPRASLAARRVRGPSAIAPDRHAAQNSEEPVANASPVRPLARIEPQPEKPGSPVA